MTRPAPRAQTILDLLQLVVQQQPERPACTYLADGEDQEVSLSYAELDREVRSFAGAIRQMARPGERALLMYPSGIEFVTAFLGCLHAGVVAVPIITPHPKRDVPRLRVVLGDSQASVACGRAALLEQLPSVLEAYPEFGSVRWLASENVELEAPMGQEPHVPNSTDLAFLQYTSGSTSAPKGVMISHANLLNQIRDFQIGSDMHPGDTSVMWLPAFHDMGLICGLLTPLCAGAEVVFMAPVAFLERPFRWLRAITKHRGTHTAAPNFAYELCVHKIAPAERATLDLSSLRFAVNGAEPVRLSTLRAFNETMGPRGFSPGAVAPAYGLAESVAKVTSGGRGQELSIAWLDPEALKLGKLVLQEPETNRAIPSVGCGTTSIGADIRIVDPGTLTTTASDSIGEIWVSSGSVAQGYWRKTAETDAAFGVRLADSGEGPFLRTGDLGFLHKGQLHITGRIKDMIIVRGRNYYPQDVELSVQQAHPAMQLDGGAVFSLDDEGTERLVVIQEVRREFRKSDELPLAANAVRMAVARNHGLRADSVVFILPSRLPKTTSGKVQRHAAREQYLGHRFEPLFEWHAPRG